VSTVDVEKLEREKDIYGLLAALKDRDGKIRLEAVKALGRVGDARVTPALTPLLNDPYSEDPADLYRCNREWEEMGDESPIYLVANAAREVLEIFSSSPADAQGVDYFTIKAGDLVKAWRRFFQNHFEDWTNDFINSTWRVLSLGPEDVHLFLEKGEYLEGWDSENNKWIYHEPGFTLHLKNSNFYNQAFPDSLPYQEFLDTFMKVG
jgi:hypothetical protein